MAYLMGIDLGSTSIKAVVYDYTGTHVASGSAPTPLSYLDKNNPTHCVWEPEKIWNSVVDAVRQAVHCIKNADDIDAVAVTGFGMDGLPLDKNGRELYPLISWHCPRTIPISQEYSTRVGAKNIFDRTGKQIMDIDSIYRMIWMNKNHPEIMEQTDKWLLIEDYINFRLCGEKHTDYSMATTTSVFDQRTHDWCDDLIEKAGVPRSIFPKADCAGYILGNVLPYVAEVTGLSVKTKVVLGGHDYICSALPAGCIDGTKVLDITGTWEMIVLATDSPLYTENVFNSGYYVEGHVVSGQVCYVGSAVCGDMTEWMRNQLCTPEHLRAETEGKNIWACISEECAKSAPGSRGCTFLPHFSGAGAPVRDPLSRGAFIGLHNCVTRGDMLRSVFEGLDYMFRDQLDSFIDYKVGSPETVIATGGATRNQFWMQNKADVTGRAIEVPDIYEATPLGVAMAAGIGAGVYRDAKDAVAAVRKDVKIYEPDAETHKLYDDYYHNIYKKIQSALKDVNAEISTRFV